MRSIRSTLLALTPLTLLLVTAQTALAQTPTPSPTSTGVEKGFCAPWHHCLALGGLSLAGLVVLALAAGYLVQRRGFDKIEHRQGNPEGVSAD